MHARMMKVYARVGMIEQGVKYAYNQCKNAPSLGLVDGVIKFPEIVK